MGWESYFCFSTLFPQFRQPTSIFVLSPLVLQAILFVVVLLSTKKDMFPTSHQTNFIQTLTAD